MYRHIFCGISSHSTQMCHINLSHDEAGLGLRLGPLLFIYGEKGSFGKIKQAKGKQHFLGVEILV